MTFPFPSHYLPSRAVVLAIVFHCLCHSKNVYDDDDDDDDDAVILIVTLIIIGIPSPTHSLTLGLNPSFSANPPYPAFPFSPSGFTIWISQTVYCYF